MLLKNLLSVITVNSNELPKNLFWHLELLVKDKGDWNPSIYDWAWVLACDYFDEYHRNRQLTNLLAKQHTDGTWGDSSYLPHSSLVDTLAMIMTLVINKTTIPKWPEITESINRLLTACSAYRFHPTVAFELIIPSFITWIEENSLTIELSSPNRDYISLLQEKLAKKLRLLQSSGRYSRNSTLSYTAELLFFLSPSSSEIEALTKTKLPNGAIGLSPAATAATILMCRKQGLQPPVELYTYLTSVFDDYKHDYVPNLHPITTSRQLWNLLPWLLSKSLPNLLIHDRNLLKLIVGIYCGIKHDEFGRVSWDVHNQELPDLDDTAVSFALYSILNHLGVRGLNPIPFAVFEHFRDIQGNFFCYPHELHPSPVATLHNQWCES